MEGDRVKALYLGGILEAIAVFGFVRELPITSVAEVVIPGLFAIAGAFLIFGAAVSGSGQVK